MNAQKFAALALFATGCNNPWDGSWLFRFDQNSATQSGDCADTGGGTPDTYFGTQDAWADMVLLGNGQVTIDIGGTNLLGEEAGGVLTASAVEGRETTDGFLDRTTTTLSATLKGDVMTGTVTVLDEQQSQSYYGDPNSYTCTSVGSFEADRVVSKPKQFVTPSSTF